LPLLVELVVVFASHDLFLLVSVQWDQGPGIRAFGASEPYDLGAAGDEQYLIVISDEYKYS
jgi:hypothetical protein